MYVHIDTEIDIPNWTSPPGVGKWPFCSHFLSNRFLQWPRSGLLALLSADGSRDFLKAFPVMHWLRWYPTPGPVQPPISTVFVLFSLGTGKRLSLIHFSFRGGSRNRRWRKRICNLKGTGAQRSIVSGYGGDGLMVGLDDLSGLIQSLLWFY